MLTCGHQININLFMPYINHSVVSKLYWFKTFYGLEINNDLIKLKTLKTLHHNDLNCWSVAVIIVINNHNCVPGSCKLSVTSANLSTVEGGPDGRPVSVLNATAAAPSVRMRYVCLYSIIPCPLKVATRVASVRLQSYPCCCVSGSRAPGRRRRCPAPGLGSGCCSG